MAQKNILIWEVLPFLGGGQRVSLQIGLALQKTGNYNVEYVIPGDGDLSDALRSHGFRYHILPVNNYSLVTKNIFDYFKFAFDSFRTVGAFYGILRKSRVDLIYINGSRAFIWGAIAGQLLSIPVIWHIHNPFRDKFVTRLLGWFGSLPAVKKTIFVSYDISKTLPRLHSKAVVIYNGIDISRFTGVNDAGIRKEFDIKLADKIITSIGIIQPEKHQDTIIRAFAMVVKKYPDARLFLAGRTRKEYIAYMNELSRLAEASGAVEKIKFLGERSDIPAILKVSALSVVAGQEGFSLALLESGAVGIPVIGPDISGAAELIAQSNGGETFRYKDHISLSDTIVKILQDPVLFQTYAQNGLRFAKLHTTEIFSEKIIHEIERVLNG
ncbi:MAG: glycosyltransferase family 4 protein [Candidatus Omnitrophica bacterium]|jgi:glycosyltransferase involved in cell wall biosynthesis|nr:glycosyltransferase family 4 protein [Candidatus Omnitrophota bacterium]